MAAQKAKRLTDRHVEIILLMADGKSREVIADLLNIRTSTVNGYLKSAMDITGTFNATGLVGMAFRKGWIN